MIINIVDVLLDARLPGTHVRRVGELCGPMNALIATFPHAKYQGAQGIRMASRPRPGYETEAFHEPMWVWTKRV